VDFLDRELLYPLPLKMSQEAACKSCCGVFVRSFSKRAMDRGFVVCFHNYIPCDTSFLSIE
jgi:hypothetical protein